MNSQQFRFSPNRCLIVGEVAQAHDGSLGLAHAFIDAIAKSGADAVKFQTHIAEAESTPDEPWRVKFSPKDETRFEYWKRMEFSESEWLGLHKHADERGLIFLSSPFSIEAVELLMRVGVAGWKIASGEVNNSSMFRRLCQTGKPVMLSTGMSPLCEIEKAVELLRVAEVPFALLQCTSSYPCPPEKVGLNLIREFRERYQCPVGLSDHSATIFPGLAAATLGIEVLEVHVTLSREMFGPDVCASVTSEELHQLVDGVRFIERMNANPVDKDLLASETTPLRHLFTKSVTACADLPAGTLLRPEHLTVKKPGTGIPADQLDEVIGRRLRHEVKRNQILSLDHLEQLNELSKTAEADN